MQRNIECIFTGQIRAFMVLFAFFAIALSVDAQVIGVSPSNLDFGRLERGQNARIQLAVITTDPDLICEAFVEGDISEWIKLDEYGFNLEKGTPKKIGVSVSVPEAAPNGIYEGLLRLRVLTPKESLSATSMAVSAGMTSRIRLEVSGRQGQWFRVLKTDFNNPRSGEPVRVEAIVRNDAAITIFPKMHIEIMTNDRRRTLSQTTVSKDAVEPESRSTLTAYLPTDGILEGAYILYLWISASNETFEFYETLNILGLGAQTSDIVIDGSLYHVMMMPQNITLGNKITVYGDFRNTGNVPIYAKLAVKIEGEENKKAIHRSDEVYFDALESKRIFLHYEPEYPGDYKAYVWAEYAGKSSHIHEYEFRVWQFTGPLAGSETNINYFILPAIALILGWLFIYYRKYYVRDFI